MKRIVILVMLGLGLTAQAQWYTGMSQKTGLALCIHLISSSPSLGEGDRSLERWRSTRSGGGVQQPW